MSTERSTTRECPRCEELDQRNRQLEERNRHLEERVAELEGQVARLKKNSSTSSKPPSSDIVKKKKPKSPGRGKGKRGGQPGHPRHERKPFDPSDLDYIYTYYWECCPCCGGEVEVRQEPRGLQQVELIEHPIEVHEHRGSRCWCPHCKQTHYCGIPDDIRKAGLTGPRLTALVAYMKSACHCSFSNIRKFLRDVVGISISRGHLRKLCAKVTESLQGCYDELSEQLVREALLNVDETGHKENGKRFWTWCFRASLFTVFRIEPSRGTEVLMKVLGDEFKGLLGCDYFSAYRKYMKLNENVLVQFCLAHLIRDVKFLVTHPNPDNRAHGERLTELFRKLFRIIHRRDEYKTEDGFRRALEDVEARLLWYATIEPPKTKEAANLAKRFNEHGDAYFRFITTPDIEPTNNLAEQAIRFVAIHRRMTQGTRGEPGRRWCERIWTAVVTCEQQSRSVFDFIYETVVSFFAGEPTPSLAPDT